MFSLFNDAKRFFKHIEKVTTDNTVFRLHYKATVLLHIAFMCLLGSKQYFGEPIICNKTGSDSLMDVYCWIHGTWTVDELFQRRYEKMVPHPGIGYLEPHFTIMNHSYYQWIPVVLLLSAACFYLPRYLWKSEERGRMARITSGLKDQNAISSTKEHAEQLIHFMEHSNNYLYAQRFAFCELLNLLNLFWQWYFLDAFLEGSFLTYGADYLRYYFQSGEMGGPSGYNPMDKVFPKMAKCSYDQIAGEGGIQKKDAICVLPLNIINDRVFLILWFWFIFLSVVTVIALILRVICCLSRTFRRLLLSRFCSPRRAKNIHDIIHGSNYHTWFLMYQVAKNVDGDIFDEFISRYSKDILNSRIKDKEREKNLCPHSETTSIDSDVNAVLLHQKPLQPESPFIHPSAHSYPTLRNEDKGMGGGFPLESLVIPTPTSIQLSPSPLHSPSCPPKTSGKPSIKNSYDVSS